MSYSIAIKNDIEASIRCVANRDTVLAVKLIDAIAKKIVELREQNHPLDAMVSLLTDNTDLVFPMVENQGPFDHLYFYLMQADVTGTANDVLAFLVIDFKDSTVSDQTANVVSLH